MEVKLGKIFKNDAVVMDDIIFIDCTFEGCVLIYSGGERNWVNCRMTSCRVVLQGAACRTQDFLMLIGWKPPQKSEIPLNSTESTNFGPN